MPRCKIAVAAMQQFAFYVMVQYVILLSKILFGESILHGAPFQQDLRRSEMTSHDTVALVTKAGLCITVRPANEKDDPALAAFFEHVSKDDLRFRFLSAVQKVSPEQIAAMTHVDHRQTEDFLVFETGGSEIIGNAMLAADKSLQTAEVAFTVHSDFKGKGIESALLKYVTENARARGIKKLQSIESRENHCTIELERTMGFTARSIEGDPMLVLLEASL
jgi:acetyltransferase